MIQPRNATIEVCCTDTLRNLLDTSSKDQGNQSKTLSNSYNIVQAKRNHFRKERGSTKRKNCLLPFIVFIMLCSVVNGDPPTALTSGLLNTAATGDTTIALTTGSLGYTSHTMAGMPQTVYVGMNSLDIVADNIKIFKYDLTLACKATWSVGQIKALVIKGPGKVFAGSFFTTSRQLYTISYAAGTYSMTLTTPITSISAISGCGDDDSTNNYAYVVSSSPANKINKVDMATGVETTPVAIAYANNCAAGPSVNYVVITDISVIYIRFKTDMSAFVTATRSSTTGATSIMTVDNLVTGTLYYFATTSPYQLVKADLNTATATTVTEVMLWSVGNTYGKLDRPLNFGPYQYVVTLTLQVTSAHVLAIGKTDNSPAVTASFPIPTATRYTANSIAGPMLDYSYSQVRAYVTGIASLAADNWNVQSYYLTVDRCVTRTALICTDCVAPYYRVGTSANNLCQTPAEFAASKFGIESNVTRLANFCSDINCIDCTYNKDTCITCKTAWYLDTTLNQCRHPTITPHIADGYGVNPISGQIDACQVAHCQLC